MICALLRIIEVVELYRVAIDAYADGMRGDELKELCADTFFGDNLLFRDPPGGDQSAIWDLIHAANQHVWEVEEFFNNRVSFAGMLP